MQTTWLYDTPQLRIQKVIHTHSIVIVKATTKSTNHNFFFKKGPSVTDKQTKRQTNKQDRIFRDIYFHVQEGHRTIL